MNFQTLVGPSPNQTEAVENSFRELRKLQPEAYRIVRERFFTLEGIRSTLERMPLIRSTAHLPGMHRNVDSLIQGLLVRDRGSRLLYEPVRAVLGRACATAEAQAWASLSRACSAAGVPEKLRSPADDMAAKAVVDLMVEDCYKAILDGQAEDSIRSRAAASLIQIWDDRPYAAPDKPSRMLSALWASRRRTAPAFGTLLGSSEMLGLSLRLDDEWFQFAGKFLRERSLGPLFEEFLFGLSYEELSKVRARYRKEEVFSPEDMKKALGNVRDFPEPACRDPRYLYRFFEARRMKSRTRLEAGLPGPRTTLEEDYVRWSLEREEAKIEIT